MTHRYLVEPMGRHPRTGWLETLWPGCCRDAETLLLARRAANTYLRLLFARHPQLEAVSVRIYQLCPSCGGPGGFSRADQSPRPRRCGDCEGRGTDCCVVNTTVPRASSVPHHLQGTMTGVRCEWCGAQAPGPRGLLSHKDCVFAEAGSPERYDLTSLVPW